MSIGTYSKAHPGQFALFLDFETSGSDFTGDSSLTYQGISFGAVVANTETWEPVDTLYRELHFDESKYKWADEAEKIHGLSREYLQQHGVSREQGLIDLLELIMKYWLPGTKIMLGGHNIGFDKDFADQLCRDNGVDPLQFHHVFIETSSLAYALTREYKSNVVFELLGELTRTGSHNALDDAKAALAVVRNCKQIFALGFGG